MAKETEETNGDTEIMNVFEKRVTGKKVTVEEAERAVDALAENRKELLAALVEGAEE